MSEPSQLTTGGELWIVDGDHLHTRLAEGLRHEGAAIRLESTAGELSVTVAGRTATLAFPSDVEAVLPRSRLLYGTVTVKQPTH